MATGITPANPGTQKKRRGASGRNPFAYALRIGVRAGDTLSLIEQIQGGFSFQTFEALQQQIAIPSKELARVVQIAPRTLTRRKQSGRLQPDESERVLRISRLFDQVVRLFEGDLQAARHWLGTKREALGGHTPLEFMQSEIGARVVEELIGRLEYGVYS